MLTVDVVCIRAAAYHWEGMAITIEYNAGIDVLHCPAAWIG